MPSLEHYAEIRVFLDAFFNGIILDGFGCGLYTLILAQAIWKLHRKGNKAVYSAFLIILWMSAITTFACDWAKLRAGFVVHNSSPDDTFVETMTAPLIVDDIAGVFLILISDAILIWRCNILWQKKIILIPLCALYATTAAFYIRTCALRDKISVLAAFISVMASALTTITATFFITMKIVRVTRESHMHHSYSRVIRIIIESGALVSTFMLALAILQLISFLHSFKLNTISGRVFTEVTVYASASLGPVLGIGPTLIAFRVAEEAPRTEVNTTTRSNPLSRLTFRRTAGNTTADTQARDQHVSTIRFTSVQEEQVNSLPGSMHMQAHGSNLDDEEKRSNPENLAHLGGTESV